MSTITANNLILQHYQNVTGKIFPYTTDKELKKYLVERGIPSVYDLAVLSQKMAASKK
jgi:rRNA-processing protein FCF1